MVEDIEFRYGLPAEGANDIMFRAGAFVADHVSPVNETQIQPNGVDLTAEQIAEPIDAGRIATDGKTIADRQELAPTEVTGDRETFYLAPGAYVVRYGETVHIPDGHVGFIYPRSSLLRNGAMLYTAVWDAGYEGQGAGLLSVYSDLEIDRGARIGQLVLARAGHETTYDGSYQGEAAN